MPLRRSQVDALEVIAYTEGVVTLDLRVSSGTYVRSIADALGGHCVALRRTEVGPFTVEEADAERVLTLEDALGRIGLTVAEAEAERRRKSLADREAHRRRQAQEQADREHDDRAHDEAHAPDGSARAGPADSRPGARRADKGESQPCRGGEHPASGRPGSGSGSDAGGGGG
jgi:tRNA U55 pseudouridine synthase TruB